MVKQHLCDHADPLIGIVQCGNECLIPSWVSPVGQWPPGYCPPRPNLGPFELLLAFAAFAWHFAHFRCGSASPDLRTSKRVRDRVPSSGG
jgi:hypothetical protein